MHQEVILEFGPEGSWTVHLGDVASLAFDEAQRWLDAEFLANDCAPIRATGKVLVADKVLIVARTVGARRFADDAAYRKAFARAAAGALGKPLVRVDVAAGSVGY